MAVTLPSEQPPDVVAKLQDVTGLQNGTVGINGVVAAIAPLVVDATEASAIEDVPMTNAGTTSGGEKKAAEPELEAQPESKPEVQPEPQPDPGSIASFQTIYRVKDKDGEATWSDKEPEDVTPAAENSETAKYAVILRSRKSSSSRRQFEAHSIIIQSRLLKKALGEVLAGYPEISCDLERLVFYSPFEPFVHRWPELLAYHARPDLDQQTKEHLTVLIDILKDDLRDSIKAYEDYVSKGVVPFEHVWMIFQPGTIVISASKGSLSAYKLKNGSYVSCRGGRNFALGCNVVEWSGSEFGWHTEYLGISEFKGTAKILNLPVYPLKFHPDQDSVKALLIQKGQKFVDLAGYHFKTYKGIAISWNEEREEVPVHHDGRIVIDCKAFNRYSPWSVHCTADFSAEEEHNVKTVLRSQNPSELSKGRKISEQDVKYELSDYFLMLCHNRVRGYSVQTKKWLDFYVTNVDEIQWNTRAFDSLVLPEDQKQLILAFAESQVENRESFDDVVKGKGQGIIILLSGKPGIGKTLTAESVAEDMRRPLHTVSAGDLGSSAHSVEQNLNTILELVGRWNAVLLLDECDVFLEARANHDLERNALVSTFLRTLEYYNGILFMTSNRADNIDTAFESRIHVSMRYPDLTAASRKRIWANFLSTQSHTIDDDDLNELAEVDLNGRQIKNIIKTSHLLASRKKSKLSMKEIKTVFAIEDRRPERKNKA